MPLALDHLVLVVPDLDAAVTDLERRTGARPVAGGAHPGRGTHNALLGLRREGSTRSYLEILARDPAQPDVAEQDVLLGAGPTLATGVSRLFGWAVRTEPAELAATLQAGREAGADMGEEVAASRHSPGGLELSWRLAVPRPLGYGGVQPFLLAWEDAHPTDADLPTVDLLSLELRHPAAERAGSVLRALGVTLPVLPGPAASLTARLSAPRGEVVLT
jgi:hypothetical protein